MTPIKIKFFRRTAGYTVQTTKEMKTFWNSWK